MTSQEFDEIYNEHWKYVYWLCRRLLHHEDAALDAAQDVFCRKWKAIHTYDPAQGSFKNWLTRNTYNHCIDVMRKGERRDEAALDDEVPDVRPASAGQLDWKLVLAEAMEALSEQERFVLILRFVSGFTRGEIETLMDLSPSKIRTLEEKGLRRLRDWMTANGIETTESEN